MAPSSPINASTPCMGVDYVITFSYQNSQGGKAEVAIQLQKLIGALDQVGMRTEVRDGTEGKLLVFVKVRSAQKLVGEVYRSRVKDWLHGVRPAAPDKETQRTLDREPLTEAEKLRIVYAMLTLPESEGGAGITPQKGQWTLVEGIFPLHNREFNKELMKSWSTKWTLSPQDLRRIRDMFGEKVAYYFAFLQSYLSFLTVAASFGAAAYFVLPQYSLVFAVANCLWSVVFVEYWKRQEVDLAVRWNVRNVSQLQSKRAQFQPEGMREDPITGEVVKTYPAWKRFIKQFLQVPFTLGASGILSALYASVFGLEVLIAEVYSGPFKSVLAFTPTVILAVMVPLIIGQLSGVATKLTDFENYENESSYEAAMTQKVFVFNFICSYIPLFLTAFIYTPFGNVIVPRIDIFNLLPQSSSETLSTTPAFQINPGRLRKQMIQFTVTAQVVNLAMETVVPHFKRSAFKKAKEIRARRNGQEQVYANDPPEEKEFLARVRNEVELDTYNVTDDLREMCMQFGYLSLFAPIWPLAAVSFVINNWIELRSDAAKICVEMRRPVPDRADSIGPWLQNLGFLTWLGSVTTAALVYLFSAPAVGQQAPTVWTLAGILGSIVFSEHIYFLARVVVRVALSNMDSPGLTKERQERFMVRRRFLHESLGVDEETETKVMEGDAFTGEEGSARFWNTQKGPQEAIEAGLRIMSESKKEQ